MKAKVTTEFRGKRDGAPQVELIKVGEIITGELAKVAVDEQWAEEIDEAKEAKIGAAQEKLSGAEADLVAAKAKLAAAAEADKAAAEKEVAEAQDAFEAATKALTKLTK
jgi:hypothetical protein